MAERISTLCATCDEPLELATIARVNFWLCSRCAAFSVAGGNLAPEQAVAESEAVRLKLQAMHYRDRIRRPVGRDRLDLEADRRAREWVQYWLAKPAWQWP